MNLAIFTDYMNATLLKSIINKYNVDINTMFVIEMFEPKESINRVYFWEKDKDKTYDFLTKYKIDTSIVYGWNYKIPLDIVNQIPFYNIHPSLLPLYRGPIPAIFQLLNGEVKSGVTIHKMNEYFDKGDIYKQKEFKIAEDESLESLNMKLTRCAFHLIKELLRDLICANIKLYHQDENAATYYSYNDINKYVINNKISYKLFKRIYHTLCGRYPVKAIYDMKEVEVLSYSEERFDKGIEYNLLDKLLYLRIK